VRKNMSLAVLSLISASSYGTACTPTEPNRLDTLPMIQMTINEQRFELWVVDTFAEQNKGLMFVTAEQMAPMPNGTERGMLFVFDYSTRQSFWMKNTIIPLDIAYITTDGTVVATYTMTPLDERSNQYPPGAPYRYAIEVNAGVWSRLGVVKGATIQIPASVR